MQKSIHKALFIFALIPLLFVGVKPQPSTTLKSNSHSNVETKLHPSHAINNGSKRYSALTEESSSRAINKAALAAALPYPTRAIVGLVLRFGGLVLTAVGMFGAVLLLTYGYCITASFCDSFHWFGNLNRRSMRSLLTENNIESTMKFLSESITKYYNLNTRSGSLNR